MTEAEQIRQVMTLLDPAPLAAWLARVPPQQWLAVLLGPALVGAAPLVRRFWPSYAGGTLLFQAPLVKPVSWWRYWGRRSAATVSTALGVAGLFLGHPATLVFLLGGGSVTLVAWLGQRRIRQNVLFRTFSWEVNGTRYSYEKVLGLEHRDAGWLLRTDRHQVRLSKAQYESLRPHLQRTGIGSGETSRFPSDDHLNLK